jgi:hypothetical protein
MATCFHGPSAPRRSFPAPASLVAAALLASSGCAGAAPGGASNGIGNAIVIGDESFGSAAGSILTVLKTHIRSMSVAPTDGCPHILLRPGRSQSAEALIYIDGQRMSDTCILDGLNLEAIQRVEVYPSGVTQRPGYRTNAGGLILVFTKNGPDPDKQI